jgi:hypothetical protein
VPADHGLVAVPVAGGQHIVDLRYASPYHGAGWWVTGLALFSAAALVVFDRWRLRPQGSRALPRKMMIRGVGKAHDREDVHPPAGV